MLKKNNYILFFAFAITIFMMSSCSQEENYEESSSKLCVRLKSNINKSQIKFIIETLDYEVERCMRSNNTYDITPEIARAAATPLIEDGKILQQSILAQIDRQEINNKELISDIENLTDEELAAMSFIIALVQPTTDIEFGNPETMDAQMAIRWDVVRPCVTTALGIYNIDFVGSAIFGTGGVEIGSLVSALKFLGKHYVGWVGLAWFILDTVDCLKSSGVI